MEYKTLLKNRTTFVEKIKIYNPSTVVTEFKYDCLGEKWFLNSKFWKLQLMFGYDCHSNFITTRGFTFSRIMGDHNALNVADVLKFNDIEFTMDYVSVWTLRINISAKKANLKKIDDLYEKFYKIVKNNDDFAITMKNWMDNTFNKIA